MTMNKTSILEKYNISEATLRNWKKLNYINDLNHIQVEEINKVLENKIGIRRNKRTLKNNIIPKSYVNDKKIISIIEQILQIKEKYNASIKNILHDVVINILENNNLTIPEELTDILGERSSSIDFIDELKNIKIEYEENNDFLGCLYMSLISVGKKDTNGIYYTPYNAVNKIISSLNFKDNECIADPACGSGNFLIQAFKSMKNNNIPTETIINNLYGFDIDPIACLLAKINIYILDKNIDYASINIYNKDFLIQDFKIKFNVVIGNPPWGKKYTTKEKNELKDKHNIKFSKLESFSQFILRSFELLHDNGILSFVLPSSILNIATHENIRNFLLKNKIIYIKTIGREFEEIVTDVILLQVKKEPNVNNVCFYNDIKIDQNYFKTKPYSNFLVSDKIATNIIDTLKKYNCYHLIDNIDYALGIVTGNNKDYILTKKIQNSEPIISGKDICKYKMNYSKINNFIVFEKNNFQQVANVDYYRCKNKIVYKFIGKKLCFSVENNGLLTLNSANIICFKNNINLNYISAILNSRITQLFFDESYNTNKVLKNHIQSFYIPKFSKEITNKINNIVKTSNVMSKYNEEIEDIIYTNLKLTKNEINYLKNRYN